MSENSQWSGKRNISSQHEHAAKMQSILYEVKRVVVGQDAFLERVLIAILAGGHILIEGVPGLAKTLTVNSLAKVVQGKFRVSSLRLIFCPLI